MTRESRHVIGSAADDKTDNGSSLGRPNRRSFLKGAAGAAAVGAGLAAGSTATASEEYGTVYDAVADLGADPTGEEPINDALAEAVDNKESVKVIFPDGDYLVDEGDGGNGFARWDFGEGDEEGRLGDIALVGEGNVTVRPRDGHRHHVFILFAERLHIENFTVDQTADDTSSGIYPAAEEELYVGDIYYDGKVTGDYVEYDSVEEYAEADQAGEFINDPFALTPTLLNETGAGVVENIQAPHGVEPYSRKGAVWVPFTHAGDVLFRNCEFSNFSDNALYGSPPGQGPPLGEGGSVRVEKCHFENNNITAIRLGTPGSYAKNCTVITEEGEIPATPWGAITSRAGWVWYDFNGSYRNIDVIHNHPAGEGILDHNDNTRDLHLDVQNCRFELNAEGSNAIRAMDPGVETLTARNIRVTGDAGEGSVVELGNTAVDIRNLCLSQSGAGRDGISISNAAGTIVNADIDVTGEQIVGDADGVEIRNLRNQGACSTGRRVPRRD